MSRNVTLERLRSDILEQADLTGAAGPSARYKPDTLNRWINQSNCRFRERVSTEGFTRYLTSFSSTFAIGVTSPFAFQSLDLGAVVDDLVRVYSIELVYQSRIYTLQPTTFQERNEFGGTDTTGLPVAFAHYQADKIAILPAPDQAYAYTLWYLPSVPDMADDNDPFDGVNGWEEYIVWDVVSRMCIRDKYLEVYNAIIEYRENVVKDIIKAASRVSLAGGHSRARDTLGDRLYNQGSRQWRPPLTTT